jgi:prepilin signal peptidase PulO-like enzyme (type II secretory pathway)
MTNLILIYSAIIGAIVGSFLNVVVMRFGTGVGLRGRSRCASSGKTLAWYELIPIVSYCVQGGRSRHTGKKLSLQYPLVELGTSALFVFATHRVIESAGGYLTSASIVQLLSLLVVLCLGVCVFVYDMRHKIIPDVWSFSLALIGFVSLFIYLDGGFFGVMMPSWVDVLAGPILATPFALLWRISNGAWIGLGDAKLLLGLGWLLGFATGVAGLLLGVWIGAMYGVLLLLTKKADGATEIPFGPFLLIGALVAFVWGIDVAQVSAYCGELIAMLF